MQRGPLGFPHAARRARQTAPDRPGPSHAARAAEGFKLGRPEPPRTLGLCRPGSACAVQPGRRALGACKAAAGDMWVSRGISTLVKKKKKKGLAVSKAVLSEKVIFHACASEGRGVGPDGASGRRESFGTGPMASLPRFRRNRSSGPLALGSSSRRNVAYPCLVWNAQHILDNMSVLETCYFINSFLLTLCSLQMLPEQIKPLSDEKS